jgi:hypothetical protein
MTRLRLPAPFATLMVAIVGCGGDTSVDSNTPDLGRARVEHARSCLADAGFFVLGGPRPKGDRNAPDFELTVQLRGPDSPVGAFVAFYRREGRAAKLEPEIRRNGKRFNGVVERRGAVTVVWTEKPPPKTRNKVARGVY